MRLLRFSLIAVVLSVAGFLFAWRWAVCAVLLTDFSGPVSMASIIQMRHPVCIVSPHWIHATDSELVIRWQMAEVPARLGVVFLLWCGGVILAFIVARRRTTAINPMSRTETSGGAQG